MRLLNVGIVSAIHRAQRSVSGDTALEFLRHFLDDRFFERIGATSDEDRGYDEESDREGLQARRILKK
jgi:hypothetical protein